MKMNFESIKNSLTYDMEIEAVYLKGDFERLDYIFNLIFEKEEGKC